MYSGRRKAARETHHILEEPAQIAEKHVKQRLERENRRIAEQGVKALQRPKKDRNTGNTQLGIKPVTRGAQPPRPVTEETLQPAN